MIELTIPEDLRTKSLSNKTHQGEYKFFRWWLSNKARKHTTKERTRSVVDCLDIKGNERVLDIGCAWGYSSFYLTSLGANVIGVDIFDGHLEVARKLAECNNFDVEFKQDDATNLHFEDESFECAIQMEALEHIDSWEKSISEISRVLKPGGKAVISTPNVKGIAQIVKKILTKFEVFAKIWDPDEHFIPEEEVVRALTENNLVFHKKVNCLLTVPFTPDFLFPIMLLTENLFERLPLLREICTTSVYYSVKSS